MGLRLHKEYGVNPTIPLCFLCGKAKNQVVLLGANYKERAPMYMHLDKEPCDNCKNLMEQGIILIGVRDGENGDNPFRTGHFIVIKEESFKKMVGKDHPSIKKRVCFIEETVLKRLGFLNEDGTLK